MKISKKQPAPDTAFLEKLDSFIAFSEEKIAQNGEDSFYYSVNEVGAIASVFDGCGGAGAKRYVKLQNKTGAYIASRAVGGAAKKWFLEACTEGDRVSFDAERLKWWITEHLRICCSFDSPTALKLKGSMAKEFPSTLAAVTCRLVDNNILADVFWAGDSRCYLLNEDGLFLLTKDDLAAVDLYEDYSCDGVMTNVISASKDFVVHKRSLQLNKPGVLFAATDGCFAYFSTPMEFEFALLEALLKANSQTEWERNLNQSLGSYAQDDYSFCALSFGFDSFENTKKAFVSRANHVYEQYMGNLIECSNEDKRVLWHKYRDHFLSYINP